MKKYKNIKKKKYKKLKKKKYKKKVLKAFFFLNYII